MRGGTGPLLIVALVAITCLPSAAQGPLLAPPQIDQLVSRIALYPDPLLAQVLTASTYWNQIPDAAAWADEHCYLAGDALARAISEDNLPWDPSVVALLPFPSVLDTMARDPSWTGALGNAVLAQRPEVMDAVQRMRQRAMDYGYLQSGPEENVIAAGPGDIEIVPVAPGYVFVPYYDPLIVFGRPRREGFAGVIRFGPRVFVGGAFAPWGWASPGFAWRSHAIVIDRQPRNRTWSNQRAYVHPYVQPRPRPVEPRVEHHELHGRQQPERRPEEPGRRPEERR